MRPVVGSAAEASGGDVGARGGTSGGVVLGGTAKTGVKVSSAAKWRAAEVAITGTDESMNTDDETPGQVQKSSILIGGPCTQKSRNPVEVRGNPPKTELSGWGTSPRSQCWGPMWKG